MLLPALQLMDTGLSGVNGRHVLISVDLEKDLAGELAQTPVHYWEGKCALAPTLQWNLVMVQSVQVSSMSHLGCLGILKTS